MAEWENAPGQWEDAPSKKTRGQIQSETLAFQVSLDPTAGISTGERVAAGAGKFVADVGRGIAQWTPWGPSRQEIEEVRDRDNPLMATPGGFMGNIGGGALATVPLAMIPGANTAAGTALTGSLFGAAQPVGVEDSRTVNTALGGATALGMKVGLDKLGGYFSNRAAAAAAQQAKLQQENALRDQVVREAREAGYRLTPTQAGAGSVARGVEGASGSAKMEKQLSVYDQKVTNRLVREHLDEALDALGLPRLGSKPLSAKTMDDIVSDAAKAGYRAVDDLKNVNWDKTFERSVKMLSLKRPGGAVAHPAEAQIDDIITRLAEHPQWTGKELRADITRLRELASTNFSAARRAGGDVEKTALARVQSRAAELLEELAERNLANNGAPATVISNFREARQLMAKAFTVKDALDGTGNVSARDLARSGAPLEGGMKIAANFARNFEGSARDVSKMRDRTGFQYGDILLGGVGAMVDPSLGALAFSRPVSRQIALSRLGQSMMSRPDYAVPLSTRMASQITNNPMVQRHLPLAAVPGALSVSE
mgnify:CR=1 FL=1